MKRNSPLRPFSTQYAKKLQKHAELVTKQLEQHIQTRLQAIEKLVPKLDTDIIEGIFESFELLQEGRLRIGLFVLSRTVETTMDKYIEKCLEANEDIGISKMQYKYANLKYPYFGFNKKIDYFMGEEVEIHTKKYNKTLKKYEFKMQRISMKSPRFGGYYGRGTDLHFIRKVARNPGAHQISLEEMKKIETELQTIFHNSISIIIDIVNAMP